MNNNIIMKKSKAVTLIELMVSLMVASVIIIAVYGILSQSMRISNISQKEFYLQAEMRDAALKLDKLIEKNSAVFAKSKDAIKADKTWEYIYISEKPENLGQLVIAEYDTVTKDWQEKRITDLKGEANFEVEFLDNTTKENHESLLEYEFTGILLDEKQNEILDTSRTINNIAEAGNSDRYIYDPKAGEKAVTLAVKTDKKDAQTKGVIALVIDRSSRMETKMADGTLKAEFLMEQLTKTINELDESLDIDLTFTRFDARGKVFESALGTNFLNLRSDKKAILTELSNPKYIPATSAEGDGANAAINCNLGDGYRLALHSLKEYEDYYKAKDPDFTCKKFIIIFSVGIPTYYSLDGVHFLQDDRNANGDDTGYSALFAVGDPRVYTKGSNLSIEYIKELKEKLEPKLFGSEPKDEQPKVILVLTGSPQMAKWEYVIPNPHGKNREDLYYYRLKEELGVPDDMCYIGKDEDSIKELMKTLKVDMESVLWQLSGPKEP